MDIVQSAVLHRKGKKWKSRWAVFRKITAVPDPLAASTLILYKDSTRAKNRQPKQLLPLWKYAGCAVFNKVEKVENVLMIFTDTGTILLAFENQSLMKEWHNVFQTQFGKETIFPVVIPPKQKIKAGDSTLYIYNEFFSLINDKSYRCAGRWTCSELLRCATIDGDFLFEVSHTRTLKSYTFRLKTRQSDEIVETFDYIKDNQGSDLRGNVQNQLNPGSSSIIDMERGRRNTIDSGNPNDQSFFQRTLLRVSNRFRKHARARAASVGSKKDARRVRLPQMSQPSSSRESGPSKENGSPHQHGPKPSVGSSRPDIGSLPSEIDGRPNPVPYKARSNSHESYATDPGRHQSRIKAQGRNEFIMNKSVTSEQTNSSRATTPIRKVSAPNVPPGRLKSSVGSVSGISTGSRGASMCSDVFFEEDMNEAKELRQAKYIMRPETPPRSPASLGFSIDAKPVFDFPVDAKQKEATNEKNYLNREDVQELARRQSENEGGDVILRKKTAESSLLEEIDREIKRRTREEDGSGNEPSTPISIASGDMVYQFSPGVEDKEDSGEAYVMLRTGETGPIVSPVKNGTIVQVEIKKKNSDAHAVENGTRPLANGNHEPERNGLVNYDPGVHSPSKINNNEEQPEYQNVSELMGRSQVDGAVPRGRRNSARRSSSKHLSDPLLVERFANMQQQWQESHASLRELPHETNYVNIQGKDANEEQSYVNVSATGASERKLRKGKKPPPLNFNFDKYDDDDKIYHDVGPLMGNDMTDSSEGIGSYKNIGVGSYENIAGRVAKDRAYVNVPSPTHKKAVPMLNYVLVSGGSKGGASPSAKSSRAGSLNSVNSYKSEYSMIDEKATSLLRRTREQHWQKREEDGQAQLNTPKKTKKSQGE